MNTVKPYYRHDLIKRAKELRKNATKQENHLWYDYLRYFPVKFQRQRVISGFIADFYCAAAQIVVEVDGSQHYTEQGETYDQERSAVFENYGITVLRYSNYDVDCHFSAVCEDIWNQVHARIK